MTTKNLSTEVLKETKFLNLCETTYQNKNGKTGTWVFAQRPNSQNAVMIVPILVSHTNDSHPLFSHYPKSIEIVAIKEYRVPINGYEYGFPAGLIDKNESVLETVKRELKEETGLDFIRLLKPISPPVYNSAGMTDEAVSIAFVECQGEISAENTEASEDITVYRYAKNHIASLMINISNAKFPNVYAGAKAWVIFDMFVNSNYFENLLAQR